MPTFAVRHYGQNGDGTGVTIVVASRESMARVMVGNYLNNKPGGHQQNPGQDYLEVDLFEDSPFAGEPNIPTVSSGVAAELYFPSSDDSGIARLVYSAAVPDLNVLADELDQLQQIQNEGRGVCCVRSVVAALRHGYLNMARAMVRNEMDKIRSYPDIVAVLKRACLCPESRLLNFGR